MLFYAAARLIISKCHLSMVLLKFVSSVEVLDINLKYLINYVMSVSACVPASLRPSVI